MIVMRTTSAPETLNGTTHALITPAAKSASEVESSHDRVPCRLDRNGDPVPDRIIIDPLLHGRTPISRSEFEAIIHAAPDEEATARLKWTYESVHDSYIQLVEAERKFNENARQREAAFRGLEEEILPQIKRLEAERDEKTADLRDQARLAVAEFQRRADLASAALSEAGAKDPTDFAAAPNLLLPDRKSTAQAHETLGLSSPHFSKGHKTADIIANVVAVILGPFAGLGFLAKLGALSPEVLQSAEQVQENWLAFLFAVVMGAAFFLAGGHAVKTAFHKTANQSAAPGQKLKPWIGYGIASGLFLLILSLDTVLQHEAIRVFAFRKSGETVQEGLVPIYAAMGATLILGMLVIKAYLGNIGGLAERHATSATAWMDDHAEADLVRRRNCSMIKRALELASQAVVQDREVRRLEGEIAHESAPFEAEINRQQARRIEHVSGWTEKEKYVYKQMRHTWELNSLRLEDLVNCYLGHPWRRLGWWQRLLRALGIGTVKRRRKAS